MLRVSMAALLLTSSLILAGCKRQAACDSSDSRAVCEQFQQCLRSDTSTEVCRAAEQDANKLDKHGKQ